MQVVISKCFLNHREKNGADPSCRFREKRRPTKGWSLAAKPTLAAILPPEIF